MRAPSVSGVLHHLHTTRPLLGGALLVLAGSEVIWVDGHSISVVVPTGGDATPVLLGAALVVLGVLAWATPMYAPMIGLLAQLMAVVSFIAAHLGGYVLGALLGILGGALVFAWRTDETAHPEVWI